MSGKAPASKPGRRAAAKQAAAGGQGREHAHGPAAGRPPHPPDERLSGAMMAWGAVGLVVVIIAVLVIVKATSGVSTDNATYTAVTPAPASVVHDVTNIPASVYNKVGRHLAHRPGLAPDRPDRTSRR